MHLLHGFEQGLARTCGRRQRTIALGGYIIRLGDILDVLGEVLLDLLPRLKRLNLKGRCVIRNDGLAAHRISKPGTHVTGVGFRLMPRGHAGLHSF